MSSLIVEVCKVDEVQPHPNADRMAVARIKGWYVCVAKDATTGEPWCKAGDKVGPIFRPTSIIPSPTWPKNLPEVHEVPGPLAQERGRHPSARRKGAGGEPSGFQKLRLRQILPTIRPGKASARDSGRNTTGVTKYEPPMRDQPGRRRGGRIRPSIGTTTWKTSRSNT